MEYLPAYVSPSKKKKVMVSAKFVDIMHPSWMKQAHKRLM